MQKDGSPILISEMTTTHLINALLRKSLIYPYALAFALHDRLRDNVMGEYRSVEAQGQERATGLVVAWMMSWHPQEYQAVCFSNPDRTISVIRNMEAYLHTLKILNACRFDFDWTLMSGKNQAECIGIAYNIASQYHTLHQKTLPEKPYLHKADRVIKIEKKWGANVLGTFVNSYTSRKSTYLEYFLKGAEDSPPYFRWSVQGRSIIAPFFHTIILPVLERQKKPLDDTLAYLTNLYAQEPSKELRHKDAEITYKCVVNVFRVIAEDLEETTYIFPAI